MAKSQVGVREKGANRGEVEKYQRAAGIALGSPYCYAGLYWCSLEAMAADVHADAGGVAEAAGVFNPFLRTGLASAGRAHLDRQAKADSLPARYALIFWQFPDSPFGHVDLQIEILSGGWRKCIGFNTGGGGSSRDGGGVNIVTRNVSHPLAKMKLRQIIGLQHGYSH